MDEKYKKILGISLRTIYEIFKEITKSEENISFFDFVESIGSKIRTQLEEDSKYRDKILFGPNFSSIVN